MDNLVRNHAILNVWAATNQDFQHNIQLARITPNGGVLKQYPLLWDILLTPNENLKAYYHFYQIGQIHPELLDVLKKENRWVGLNEFNIINNILIDVYSETGQIIPRDHVFISFIYNKNLVLAIRVNRKLDYGTKVKTYLNQSTVRTPYTLDNQNLIIRFYSNAWFNDVEYRKSSRYINQPIRFEYKHIKTLNEWSALFKTYTDLVKQDVNNKDKIVWYKDGFMIETPTSLPKDGVGTHMGWLFDDSFIHTESQDLKHMPAFISRLDRRRRKYIFLTSINDGLIHYWDDVDFYIVNKKHKKGVYLNRSAKHCIRQLTHNCYSLDADVIESYLKLHDWMGTIDDCYIKIMVRQGGRKNGVLNQTNRIKELYSLPREQIIEAMINAPSLVSEWRAVNLEQSAYINLISADPDKINNDLIADAYGYHGLLESFGTPLTKLNDTPNALPTTKVMNDIDRSTKTAFQSYWIYNKAGKLVDYFNVTDTDLHRLIKDYTKYPIDNIGYIESFNMRISTKSPLIHVNKNVTSWDLEQYGFKCFGAISNDSLGPSSENIPTWDDLTDAENDFYFLSKSKGNTPPKLEWNWELLSQANTWPVVYIPKVMYVYKEEINIDNGIFSIVPKFDFDYGAGVHHNRHFNIPTGACDVFVNGMSLIEGIDYEKRGHRIIVNTVVYHRLGLNNNKANVVVRYYGFSDRKTDDNWKPNEIGFVKGGRLSINGKWNIHKGKSNRVILGGLIKEIGEFKTGESDIGSVAPIEGQPYAILDYIVPTENVLSNRNVHDLYIRDRDAEDRIVDYLTDRIPEIEPEFKHVHIQRYKVVSPFMSALLIAMAKGLHLISELPDNYDDVTIDQLVTPWKWLLEFDPCLLEYDDNYVMIEPHAYPTNIAISKLQYTFLERVNDLYLKRKVDLTHNVEIREE